MLQNSYLPVVPDLGQLTVSFLQSVDQDNHFIGHFIHTKLEEGFTLDPRGEKIQTCHLPLLNLVFLIPNWNSFSTTSFETWSLAVSSLLILFCLFPWALRSCIWRSMLCKLWDKAAISLFKWVFDIFSTPPPLAIIKRKWQFSNLINTYLAAIIGSNCAARPCSFDSHVEQQQPLQRELGNLVDTYDMAWMIGLTQLLTTSKACQHQYVN